MKGSLLIFFYAIMILSGKAQDTLLISNFIYPRLDTVYWEKDWEILNSDYSRVANSCQTCFYVQSDTLNTRTCFCTSLSHIKLDTVNKIKSEEDLVGTWTVVNIGTVEAIDSFVYNQASGLRTIGITDQPKEFSGILVMKKHRAKLSLKIDGKRQVKSERYLIIDGKLIVHRGLLMKSNPRYIGITKSGYLIMDRVVVSSREYPKLQDKACVTTVTRIIFKKS